VTRRLTIVTLVIVISAGAGAARAHALTSHRVARPTLARVDRTCFYTPAPAAWWPLWPRRSPHTVHSGFNDMHGQDPMYAHWGVDVSTSTKQAKVYAMTSGVIGSLVASGGDAHFRIGPFFYYHVFSRFPPGTRVLRGQWVGRIHHHARHVHVAEKEPGCGLLDPRRPTGPLRDPMNTEHPVVQNLTADVANRAAYRVFPAWRTPDPATPLALSRVHGVVDLRAEMFDMPVRKTHFWPQQPLMVAAVRSWLAPSHHRFRRFGDAITAYDGSTWMATTASYYRVMAHGSIHVRSCIQNPSRHCNNRYILHAAGSGFDTRRFPDGWDQYCVSALTIRDVRTTRFWPIRIQNHPRRTPDGS